MVFSEQKKQRGRICLRTKKSRIIASITLILIFSAIPILSNLTKITIIMTLFTIGLIYAILAANWNLLFGFAGVWSLAQLAIFAVGAYSSALLSKAGINPWIAILVGVTLSIVAALAISLVTLRLKATYFALVTLGFQEIVRGVVVVIYPGIIFDIPHLEIFGFSFDISGGVGYYYTFFTIFLCTLFVHKKIMSSYIGYATVALRESEMRAISLGVSPVRVRATIFLVSVIFTSLLGSIYAHYTNSVSQAILGLDIFLTYLIILALGGIGTFYGPILASFMWVFLDFVLRLYLEQFRLVIMGGIVILSLIYLKQGLTEIYEMMANKLFKMK
jgi:ABC-type branched-subunit amino acid transport system permease subunit